MDLSEVVVGMRVVHRGCPACGPATVVRIADGQVVIGWDNGRRTHVDARDLDRLGVPDQRLG